MKSTTRILCYCALFAALTGVASQLIIPLPFTPIVINLATLTVFLAGGLLGAKYGFLSMAVYLLMGLVGLPVFTQFRGGADVLAGPTGGYLIGYLFAALLTGVFYRLLGHKPLGLILGMVCGLAVCYSFGTAWFMVLTGNGLWAALGMCVFPFLIGDGLKIALATFLTLRLRKAVPSLRS